MTIQRKRVAKRLASGLLAGAMALGGLAISGGTALANQDPDAERISGVDRYATSAAVAVEAFGTAGSNNFVLVSGENFPDGLAASAMAGLLQAPVLLTHPTELKGSTGNAIATIDAALAGAATIYIIGGEAAVSAGVETQLEDLGYTVNRVGGASRYETAEAVANTIAGLTTVGSYNGRRTAIVVTGTNFPDALAAGQVAYRGVHPILLASGDSLTAGAKAFLDNEVTNIGRVIIVGGTSAVSAAIATEIAGIKNGATPTAIDVVRVGGENRYATAAALAGVLTKATTLNGFGWTPTKVILVSGAGFADSLSGASFAGKDSSHIMALSAGSSLSAETQAALALLAPTATDLFTVGGTSAISDEVHDAALAALTSVTPTVTITANQGSSTVKLVFSEKIAGTSSTNVPAAGTGIGLITNFTRNNGSITAAGTGTAGTTAPGEGLVTLAADGKSAVLTLGTALSVGDVITLVSGANTATADGRRIATTSVTVGPDLVRPFVKSGKAYTTGTTALLEMSEEVTGFTDADVTCSSGATTSVTNIPTSNYWIVVCASALGNGGTLTVGTAWSDLATNAPLANKVISATVDGTAAGIATATISKTTNTQAARTTAASGKITVTAKEAALPGPLGNLWTLEIIDNDAAPAVELVDTLARKVVLGADVNASVVLVAPTAQAMVEAANADAAFSALFSATVNAAGALDATTASGALSGGQTAYEISVQMTESITSATFLVGAFDTDANGDGTADSATITFKTGTDNFLAGSAVLQLTSSSFTTMLSAGASKLVVDTSIRDFANNTPALAQAVVLG